MIKYLKLTGIIVAFLTITVAAFFLAETINDNETIRDFVQKLGLFGAIFIGIIGGLNAFVPIPPATFAPLFLEAGMSELLIITGFTIGTYVADSVGFLLGWLGSSYANTHYPDMAKRLESFMTKHQHYIPFIIFTFIALAPLPNETILIPLAIMGYQYKKLIIPLIVGNFLHHTIMVYGYAELFSIFF